jgi:enoyl-CoA hydratase/carnithine racemase
MTVYESDSEELIVELDGRVARLTLNRPEARNALSDGITHNLIRAVRWAAIDDEVGAVLLTGAGRAFCSGGDVKRMNQDAGRDRRPSESAQLDALKSRHQGIAGALRALAKPSIAALPGPAAGAGLAIALCCDFRIGAPNALISTGYANIGLSGDYGIAWLLTRTVGPAAARALLLTSDRIPVDQAKQLGIFHEVVDEAHLQDEALTLARRLAAGPLVAYAAIKKNLDDALDVDHHTAINREAERLLACRQTQDYREAIQAFTQKRPPNFKGQ